MPGERTWFADERHAEVLRLLAAEHRVESGWLARYFGVSAESIRKDLAQLEARGLLRRVHGGAVPGQRLREESNVATRTEHAEQKLAIARHAVRFVPEGGTLLLDAGTTTLRLAELLPTDRDLVVYTNAVPVLCTLLERGIAGVGLGGRVRPETGAAVGPLTVEALAGINVDVAFLGTNALSFRSRTHHPRRRRSLGQARDAGGRAAAGFPRRRKQIRPGEPCEARDAAGRRCPGDRRRCLRRAA